MTEYVTLIEALTFHADQIQRYGGDAGIRDPGALESALFRPQTGYYDDLIDEAAALWESMAQNHPFIDGNKRTAFAVTDVFLKMNGIMITASPEETTRFVYSLYDSQTFNFEELATWLRTTSISLGKHQHRFIESLVRSGRYTSTSEIVRDALRKLEESQGPEWLLSQLIEGEQGEARAWGDEALLAHVKKEAAKRGNL